MNDSRSGAAPTGEGAATEDIRNYAASSVTPSPDAEVSLARRAELKALAKRAALLTHYRKQAAQNPLTPEAQRALAKVALAALEASRKVAVTAATSPAEDIPVQVSDRPDYRAERPPGGDESLPLELNAAEVSR